MEKRSKKNFEPYDRKLIERNKDYDVEVFRIHLDKPFPPAKRGTKTLRGRVE
jgi:hypothetical protein